MNYRACIQASLDYIEDHLKDDLTAETLARIAGFSPYHYYRVFQAYVGKPVMEYIIEVSDFNRVPADLFTAEIPEAVYAIFTTPATDGEENIASAIHGTWHYIHRTWFPTSGYEYADGKADFEWYPRSNKGEKIKIYIPVVKK